MTKAIQLIVSTSAEDQKIYNLEQSGGGSNQPTRIKAVKGARYQLKDIAAKDVGPTYIRSKRVGKDLHVGLAGGGDTDLIIENYYVEGNTPADGKGLYGMAENGDLYEYVPEDPSEKGLTSNLIDGNMPVSQVLGGIPLEPTFSLAAVPGVGLGLGLGPIATVAATTAAVAAASSSSKKKDAPPVGVNDIANAKEAGGTNNDITGTDPIGNVLTNDTDADSATNTLIVQDVRGSGASVNINAATINAQTLVQGNFGTLQIAANGNYSYVVNNSHANVQELNANSAPLTDTFTYTVKDAAGATSQQTITVSINGANDAPQVQVALVDQNATTGSSFSYTFAGNAGSATDTFKDVDTGHQTGLTYTATLTDGSSLPSWLSFNASTRTFSGTPTSTIDFNIKVTASDALGLSTSDDFAINLTAAQTGDVTPPTIVVERANPASSLDAAGTETIIFTLSEASTTFDTSDIAVTGGTLSNFTPVGSSGTAASGYTKYTAVFTPTAGATGTATIGVASGKFADMAGNLNQDTYLSPAPTGAVTELATSNTNQVSVAFDTRSTNPVDNDKPTVQVSIDKSTLASGQSATLTFILSESSTNFTLADIDVISGGGTVSNLLPVAGSNGVQYTATYTAGTTAGTVQIGVDASKFTDAAGNTNADTYKGSATGTTAVSNTTAETNNWVSLTNSGSSDTTAPTIAVTRSGTGTVGASGETMVFTLSEASTDFAVGDVAVTGGALSNWVQISPTQYSATFVPTSGSNGTATIGVLAGKFSDAAGNLNKDTFNNPATGTDVFEANNQVVLSYDARTNPAPTDITAPTIAITADKSTLGAGQSATITFTLSEASADFTSADVVVTGGTLSNFAGSGTSYTATYTPTSGSQGTGSVHVDSNAFRDAASNYNQDGADVNNTVNFVTNSGVLPADTTAPTIAKTASGLAAPFHNETSGLIDGLLGKPL